MLFLLKVIIPSESDTVPCLVLRWDSFRVFFHVMFLAFVLTALTLNSGRVLTSVCCKFYTDEAQVHHTTPS